MKELTINIIGAVNTGKSTIADSIKKLLTESDIPCTVVCNDIDDNYLKDMSGNIHNLKDKINVTINVVQTRRGLYEP